MAEEEVSSLLLRVGVDFEQLNAFVAALPAVVDVAAAVGQQLDALQIGSPELFRAKGAALGQALLAGLQGEALGIQFSGQSIATVITEQVFGKLDPAAAGRIVTDVQRLLDGVRLQMPELNAPLVSQQSLNALGQVGGLASNSRRELEGMAGQLDNVLAKLALVSRVNIPQKVIERTPEGGFAPTRTARRLAETLNISVPSRLEPVTRRTTSRSISPERVSVTATNSQLRGTIYATRDRQVEKLEASQQGLQRDISSAILGLAAAARTPVAVTAPPPAALQQASVQGVAQLSQAAQRAAGALNAAAERIEKVARQPRERQLFRAEPGGPGSNVTFKQVGPDGSVTPRTGVVVGKAPNIPDVVGSRYVIPDQVSTADIYRGGVIVGAARNAYGPSGVSKGDLFSDQRPKTDIGRAQMLNAVMAARVQNERELLKPPPMAPVAAIVAPLDQTSRAAAELRTQLAGLVQQLERVARAIVPATPFKGNGETSDAFRDAYKAIGLGNAPSRYAGDDSPAKNMRVTRELAEAQFAALSRIRGQVYEVAGKLDIPAGTALTPNAIKGFTGGLYDPAAYKTSQYLGLDRMPQAGQVPVGATSPANALAQKPSVPYGPAVTSSVDSRLLQEFRNYLSKDGQNKIPGYEAVDPTTLRLSVGKYQNSAGPFDDRTPAMVALQEIYGFSGQVPEGQFLQARQEGKTPLRDSQERSLNVLAGSAQEASREINVFAAAIRLTTLKSPELFRGMSGPYAEQLGQLAPGSVLTTGFQGFSSDRSLAEGFATSPDKGRGPGGPLLVELVAGARAVDFERLAPNNIYADEKEFLTGGRFKVLENAPFTFPTDESEGRRLRIQQLTNEEDEAFRLASRAPAPITSAPPVLFADNDAPLVKKALPTPAPPAPTPVPAPPRVTLFRGEGPDSTSSSQAGRGNDLRGRFFAEDIRTAQEYAGALGRVVAVTVSATQAANARSKAVDNKVLEGLILPQGVARSARAIPAPMPVSSQLALPPGRGFSVQIGPRPPGPTPEERRRQVQSERLARAQRESVRGPSGTPYAPYGDYFPPLAPRPTGGGVQLGYGPIPSSRGQADFKETSGYRILGAKGYEALLNKGELSNPPGSKYDDLYFNRSAPLSRYVQRRDRQIYAEVDASKIQRAGNYSPDKQFMVNRGPISADDTRIYEIDRRTGERTSLPSRRPPVVPDSQRQLTVGQQGPLPAVYASRIQQLENELRAQGLRQARDTSGLPRTTPYGPALPTPVGISYRDLQAGIKASKPDPGYRGENPAGGIPGAPQLPVRPRFENPADQIAFTLGSQGKGVPEILKALGKDGLELLNGNEVRNKAVVGQLTQVADQGAAFTLAQNQAKAARAALESAQAEAGLAIVTRRLAAERALAAAATGARGTRTGIAGPAGVGFVGGALVPTGIGRGVPGFPGAAEAQDQRLALQSSQRRSRAENLRAAEEARTRAAEARAQATARLTASRPLTVGLPPPLGRRYVPTPFTSTPGSFGQSQQTIGFGLPRPPLASTPGPSGQRQQTVGQGGPYINSNGPAGGYQYAPGAGGAGAAGGGRGGRGGTPPPGGPGAPLSGPAGFGPGFTPNTPPPQQPQSRFQQFLGTNTPAGQARSGLKGGLLGGDEEGTLGFLGRSIGSAARFSLVYGAAYGALQLFTGGFSQAVQGAIEFEGALTDLNIATERSGRSNEKLAFELGNISSDAGYSTGEGVAAGARAVGLFGATDKSATDQAEIAKVSTDVATQIAFVSGQTVEQVQTQVAGITRSFGISELDQSRIGDVASYVGRRTGRPGGEILQSLGQIGTLGDSAGFDLEQVAAIIARLTSTTGQTPQAVSGFLSQVLSKADDPNVEKSLRGIGVNTQGTTLAEQIEELSTLDVDPGQRNQIVQTFGRGRSGQALNIILSQFEEIDKLAEGARNDSEGLAKKDFDQASNTVGAQIRILGSSLKDLFTGLASTGVLDALVGILEGAQLVVAVLDKLVDTFNLIPREVRTTIAVMAELALAMVLLSRAGRTAAFSTAISGVAPLARLGAGAKAAFFGSAAVAATAATGAPGAGGTAATAGRAATRGIFPAAAALGNMPVGVAARRVAAGGLLSGGLGTGVLGTGLTALGAGLGIAAVGLVTGVVANVQEAAKSQAGIRKAAGKVATASTDEEFQAARADLVDQRAAVSERENFKFFSKDSLTLGVGTYYNNVNGSVEDDKETLTKLDAAVEAREKKLKEVADNDTAGVFGGFGAEEVTQGLAKLQERGLTAAQQLNLLNQAFDGLIVKAGASKDAVGVLFAGQAESFSRVVGTTAIEGAQPIFDEALPGLESPGFAKLLTGTVFFGPVRGVAGGLTNKYYGGTFEEGFNDQGGATDNAITEVAKSILPQFESRDEKEDKLKAGIKKYNETVADPETQDRLAANVLEVLASRNKDPRLGPVKLSKDDVDAVIQGQVDTLGPALKDLPQEYIDQYVATLPKAIQEAVGNFNGIDITASNVASFLAGAIPAAQQAGADLALTSGSATGGATKTLEDLRAARARVLQGAETAETTEKRNAILEQLPGIDKAIEEGTASQTAARIARIDALAAVARSRFKVGDTAAENRLAASNIAEKLALPGLTDDEASGLAAEKGELAKKEEQDRLALNAAYALNQIPLGQQKSRLNSELDSAFKRFPTLAGLEAEQQADKINQLSRQLVDYGLDLASAVGQLEVSSDPNNSQLANRAALDDADRRLADANKTNDPKAVALAQAARNRAAYQVNVQDPIDKENARTDLFEARLGDNDSLRRQQSALVNANRDLTGLTADTPEYIRKQTEIQQIENGIGTTRLDLTAARRRGKINPGDEIANAVGDVEDALAQTKLANMGELELERANRNLALARRSLAQLQRDAASRQARLATDLTDPVAQALRDVVDAQVALDQATADGGDTTQEQLDVRSAQNNAEAQAFQQEFNDARTADELGRISHEQYLTYLANKRDRLQAIQVRTRQEQEQLDQVEQAMKAANDQLSGQFNLGDIKVPTVFEVRRSVAESLGGGAVGAAVSGGSMVNSGNYVTINGADLEEVKQVLITLLGPSATGRQPVSNGRKI